MSIAKDREFDAFLCHSSHDAHVVHELAKRLKNDGVRVWIDSDQIGDGAPIYATIQKGLERSRKFIYCLSKNASRSEWAEAELGSFASTDPLNRLRRFLYVRLDRSRVPPLLKQFHCIDWRKPNEDAYHNLLRACLPSVATSLVPRKLEGHTDTVRSVAVAKDGTLAVSGSEDHTVRVWNLKNGRCSQLTGHSDLVQSVALTADGRFAISGSKDKTARVWDVKRALCIAKLEGHGSAVTSVAIAYAENDLRSVSGTDNGTIRVWRIRLSDRMAIQLSEPIAIQEGGTRGAVYGLAVTQDGQRIVAAHANDVLRVWDVEPTGLISDNRAIGFSLKGVAVTSDGSLAVACSVDNDVRVWALQNGAWISELKGHEAPVCAVAITPDGRRIVSGSADKTVRIWDPDTADCVKTLEGHEGAVTGVAVTANGRLVVSCSSDATLRVWEVPSRPRRTVVAFDAGVDVTFAEHRPKNLYMGLATYRPGAGLRYHTHPTDEIMVVLKGRLPVRVEGRRYQLGRFDAIYIPRSSETATGRTAHLSWNNSTCNVMFIWVLAGNQLERRFLDESEIPPELDSPVGTAGDGLRQPEFVDRFSPSAESQDAPGCFTREYFKERACNLRLGHTSLHRDCSTEQRCHECDSCLMVISGDIDVHLADQYELHIYESILIPAGRSYYITNTSGGQSEFIVIYSTDR